MATKEWQAASFSHPGYRRPLNEDRYLIRSDDHFWLVADGMGGHHRGDFASNMVIEVTEELTISGSLTTRAEEVRSALAAGHERLRQVSANSDAHVICGTTVTCLLIQALLIEAFAISAYHIYIPVADPFARKITEGVVKDEYTHLNYGQEWLKANFETSRDELMEANKVNLPLIRSMLEQVAADASVLHMEKEDLIEDFLIAYQEALNEIGFSSRDIARMAAAALAI